MTTHDAADLQSRLAAFIARETGGEADVTLLGALPGGASRAAYAIDVVVRGGESAGEYPCVLRLDLGGEIYEVALGRVEEFHVLRRAHEAGATVPRVYWASKDAAVLGRDFLIMQRVEGETVGRRIVTRDDLAEARRVLPRQLGAELARIHAASRDGLDFLPAPREGEPAASAVLRRARKELDRIDEPHPALEIGWRWLDENAPAHGRTVLVHGDFRLGNVVVGEEGLRSILDWEFASAGDPHEDLAWPFVRDWRFRNDALRFAGISDGEDFLEEYERASGATVNRSALHYWEVLGNFRWALGCLTQARRHLDGREPSVELASLGRRCAEMELEMMELMERGGSASRQ